MLAALIPICLTDYLFLDAIFLAFSHVSHVRAVDGLTSRTIILS